KQQQISIEIDENTAQGVYSNLAFIAHSEQEFLMDFIFMFPQQPKAKVRSRIIISPKHAKRFLAALTDNIKKFESRFGVIPPDTLPPPNSIPGMYNYVEVSPH